MKKNELVVVVVKRKKIKKKLVSLPYQELPESHKDFLIKNQMVINGLSTKKARRLNLVYKSENKEEFWILARLVKFIEKRL